LVSDAGDGLIQQDHLYLPFESAATIFLKLVWGYRSDGKQNLHFFSCFIEFDPL
jgi:hypothetical protein